MEPAETTLPMTSSELLSTEQLKEAWLRCDPIEFGDPVLARVALPYRDTFFPLGFPVTIATNSMQVLEAANRSWGSFERLFETEPILLDVAITDAESIVCPPTPTCRVRGHLLTHIADGENFAVCDLSQASAMIWATKAAVQHQDYFRYFFLEAAAMCNVSSRRATPIHAACVAFDGHGILLCGDSGAGKSTLSYACARAGWTYITDDGSYIVPSPGDRMVVGNCSQVRFRPSAEILFPELHGLPVMQRAGVGKPSIEMATTEGFAMRVANTAPVKHVVFLKRNVATQELTTYPRGVARLFMEQQAQCVPFNYENQMSVIDQLLEIEPLELRYNELDWAVERLTFLAREGY